MFKPLLLNDLTNPYSLDKVNKFITQLRHDELIVITCIQS